MYDRVKSFMALREDGTIRGRFRDRFRFFDNTERRTQCLADLKEWNQHLNEMLASVSDVNTTRSEAFDVQVTSSSVILPFLDEGRRIFHALTSVAQHHWDCPCSSTHEAMLCLDVKPLSTNSHVRALDFLIKKSPTGSEPEPWLEGRFMIRKSTLVLAISELICLYLTSAWL